MKDYIAELENKKKKQKIWTAVFVIGFMAISLALLFHKSTKNEEVFYEAAEVKADSISKEKVEEIETEIAETQTQASNQQDSVSIIIDSLKKEIEVKVAEKVTDSLKFKLEQEPEIANSQAIRENIKEAQDNIKKIRTATIPEQRMMAQKPTDIDGYSVQIVFMHGFDRPSKMAERLLIRNKYTVIKNKQMDKFTYNRSIRFFNEEDRAEAEKIKRLLDPENQYNIELRLLNLPAPDKNIEVWIGKKD